MIIDSSTFLLVLPIIFIAGLVDSIAGGGGLLSLPAYLAAGLPPHFALGNNKFSSVFGTTLSTIRYMKNGMVDIKIASTGALFALVGSGIGTRTVLLFDPEFLNYVLVFLIPMITIFVLIKKDFGKLNSSNENSIIKKIFLSSLVGLVIGFYDGFFGPGTGAFLIFFYTMTLKYDLRTANGNSKLINLASNLAAVTTFVLGGKVIFTLGIPAALCGIAGNILGSRLVIKNGNKIIRPIFLIVLTFLFVRIVVNLF